MNPYTKTYTETIDEKYYFEAGETAIVQVDSNKDYHDEMLAQAERVLAYMQKTYPNRTFKLSKWHGHDFGSYIEVIEVIHLPISASDDDDDDFSF